MEGIPRTLPFLTMVERSTAISMSICICIVSSPMDDIICYAPLWRKTFGRRCRFLSQKFHTLLRKWPTCATIYTRISGSRSLGKGGLFFWVCPPPLLFSPGKKFRPWSKGRGLGLKKGSKFITLRGGGGFSLWGAESWQEVGDGTNGQRTSGCAGRRPVAT